MNFKADSLHWYPDDHSNEIIFRIIFDNYVIIMDEYMKWVNSAAIVDSTESGHADTGGTMNQIMR